MMKIKRDFITNSSTTSYVVFGYEVDTKKEWGSDEDGYYNEEEFEQELTKKRLVKRTVFKENQKSSPVKGVLSESKKRFRN